MKNKNETLKITLVVCSFSIVMETGINNIMQFDLNKPKVREEKRFSSIKESNEQ